MRFSRYTFLALVLSMPILAACGGGGGGSGTPTTPAPIATLSPSSVSFSAQPLNTASSAKTVTLQNTGNATLTLASSPISISGTNAAEYSFTTDCGTSLAASASCSINITFTPTTAGTQSATLNVASNAAGSPATASISGSAVDNALPVTVDSGPLAPASLTANILYADVTFCTPGTTTCAVVHHIQIDTGSYGLRVFKSALNAASGSTVVPQLAAVTGTAVPLFECVQYADGYTWGSVAVVDVQIGSRKLSNLRIQLTGDTNGTGGVPTDCSNGTPNENQVSSFGANGILGIGNFVQDCGPYCANPANTQAGNYYQCPPTSACTGIAVALTDQVQNPVALMASDNNGVLVSLPAVTGSAAATTSGYVFFGVGTQSDNMVSGRWYGLDPGYGTLSTTYGGQALTSSFIDSGSNGYFFDTTTINACTNTYDTGFYCPLSTNGTATSVTQSAVINGITNSISTSINFTIDNTDTLFTSYGAVAVFPHLGGKFSSVATGSSSNTFDWGLPFFYGRPVFVLFEGNAGPTGSGVSGPALAF